MRERAEIVLKIVCLGLGLVLFVQLVKVAFHFNPLARLVIPELPSLPADTNAPPKVASGAPVKPATNLTAPAMVSKTNALPAAGDTNAVPHAIAKNSDSNSTPAQASTQPPVAATNNPGTNTLAAALTDTNVPTTNVLATNVSVVGLAKTNKVPGTNSVVAKASAPKMPTGMFPPIGRTPAAALSPDIQARVDRVTESEILGPVIHPMPMALLGIAGNVAFLRSPSGQTGLVKEGDDLGEIKLLRIGVNRVLIEQDGQKKELTIFSGFGGESLLSTSTNTPDESTKN